MPTEILSETLLNGIKSDSDWIKRKPFDIDSHIYWLGCTDYRECFYFRKWLMNVLCAAKLNQLINCRQHKSPEIARWSWSWTWICSLRPTFSVKLLNHRLTHGALKRCKLNVRQLFRQFPTITLLSRTTNYRRDLFVCFHNSFLSSCFPCQSSVDSRKSKAHNLLVAVKSWSSLALLMFQKPSMYTGDWKIIEL